MSSLAHQLLLCIRDVVERCRREAEQLWDTTGGWSRATLKGTYETLCMARNDLDELKTHQDKHAPSEIDESQLVSGKKNAVETYVSKQETRARVCWKASDKLAERKAEHHGRDANPTTSMLEAAAGDGKAPEQAEKPGCLRPVRRAVPSSQLQKAG